MFLTGHGLTDPVACVLQSTAERLKAPAPEAGTSNLQSLAFTAEEQLSQSYSLSQSRDVPQPLLTTCWQLLILRWFHVVITQWVDVMVSLQFDRSSESNDQAS